MGTDQPGRQHLSRGLKNEREKPSKGGARRQRTRSEQEAGVGYSYLLLFNSFTLALMLHTETTLPIASNTYPSSYHMPCAKCFQLLNSLNTRSCLMKK